MNTERERITKEIIDFMPEKPHGRLILPVRFGKSRVAISLIKKNKPKSILWVTPSSHLAEIDIPKEFVKWKAKGDLKKLTTTTWKSLPKMTGHYEMIILDEEQSITPVNSETLINKSLTYNYILSMTGTKTTDFDKIQLYRALDLPILYEMDIDKAVQVDILPDYDIKVLKIKLDTKNDIVVSTKSGSSFYTSEAKQYAYYHSRVSNNPSPFLVMKRLRLIGNSPSKERTLKYLFDKLEGRVMSFSPYIKIAERISSNFYHGKSGKDVYHKFLKGEIDKLSLVNKGGVGATYHGVKHLLLMQVDSDNNGTTTQKIGRVLLKQPDLKPIIWILVSKNTQDEVWLQNLLSGFDNEKVEYYNIENEEDLKKLIDENK